MPPKPPPFQVLVLDDEKSWLRLVTSGLRGRGWTCISAGSGNEAVEAIGHSAEEVGAAVLDVNLGDVDGWQVAERLREANPSVAIVMMTGLVDASIRQKTARLPRAIVLEKPFTVDALQGAMFEAAAF
jgi:CheY-like chemotaxis protein